MTAPRRRVAACPTSIRWRQAPRGRIPPTRRGRPRSMAGRKGPRPRDGRPWRARPATCLPRRRRRPRRRGTGCQRPRAASRRRAGMPAQNGLRGYGLETRSSIPWIVRPDTLVPRFYDSSRAPASRECRVYIPIHEPPLASFRCHRRRPVACRKRVGAVFPPMRTRGWHGDVERGFRRFTGPPAARCRLPGALHGAIGTDGSLQDAISRRAAAGACFLVAPGHRTRTMDGGRHAAAARAMARPAASIHPIRGPANLILR